MWYKAGMSTPEIFPAPVLDLPQPLDDKWKREQRAFFSMLPELLTTHRGLYVAIHEGRVVQAGPDNVQVALQAYRAHGYAPMYIDLVAEHPLPPVRIPSPRVIPAAGRP
jgi:hypothetical protein